MIKLYFRVAYRVGDLDYMSSGCIIMFYLITGQSCLFIIERKWWSVFYSYLQGNYLSGSIPGELGNLSELENLYAIFSHVDYCFNLNIFKATCIFAQKLILPLIVMLCLLLCPAKTRNLICVLLFDCSFKLLESTVVIWFPLIGKQYTTYKSLVAVRLCKVLDAIIPTILLMNC